MKTMTLALILALGFGVPAYAKVERYLCIYPKATNAAGLKGRAAPMRLEFAFDTTAGKATLIGNNGIVDVSVARGDGGITFLEVLGTGAVQTTTITLATMKSVHSRHTLLSRPGNAFEFAASQNFGFCRSPN